MNDLLFTSRTNDEHIWGKKIIEVPLWNKMAWINEVLANIDSNNIFAIEAERGAGKDVAILELINNIAKEITKQGSIMVIEPRTSTVIRKKIAATFQLRMSNETYVRLMDADLNIVFANETNLKDRITFMKGRNFLTVIVNDADMFDPEKLYSIYSFMPIRVIMFGSPVESNGIKSAWLYVVNHPATIVFKIEFIGTNRMTRKNWLFA